MNQNIQLLTHIYKNSIHSISALSTVLQKLPEGDFYDFLFDKMTEYKKIANSASILLANQQTHTKHSLFSGDFSSKIAITFLMIRPSVKKISKTLIYASSEGIYELLNAINICTNALFDTRNLAFRLIELENDNITGLNKFLNK